ncbi:hypothetical protein [Microbulbifer sp. SSSA005]
MKTVTPIVAAICLVAVSHSSFANNNSSIVEQNGIGNSAMSDQSDSTVNFSQVIQS